MTTIASNLQAMRTAMTEAASSAGRHEGQFSLLAVSKSFTTQDIREAFHAGQTCFAESYAQEAQGKIEALKDLPIEWHFIGPIQSNKTRPIAENFAWVHSVDRLKIAERLSEQRPSYLPPLQVCLQVNISGETTKSGVRPDEISVLALAIDKLPRLRLRGLMAIPTPCDDLSAQRVPFAKLRELRNKLILLGLQLDTLSMGMSHDFGAAIAEGATIVRIGTAIFGRRIHKVT